MRNVSVTDMIHVLDSKTTPQDVLRAIALSGVQENAFYVLDVGDIVQKHQEWKIKMPRVEPFYAVKCNDSKLVLAVLAALGTGFDCASKAEISKVTELGVDTSRIIFANPAKMASHIRYAAANGVTTMTFDNECEIYKVKTLHPNARMVLRIRCDAAVAQCQLGMKFGCDAVTEAPRLLKLAAKLGVNVIGISFHVGSGCQDPPVFRRAISAARNLFDLGSQLGFNMHLLDIGGGYPGNRGSSIDKIADVVNAALDEFFPLTMGVSVIAEPGRFYVASAYTLATLVHSKRDTMYYINDGVYGSFNCILYDHAVVNPIPLVNKPGKLQESSVWGPTCDGLDQVVTSVMLPSLDVGDWLVFEDMGAYTLPVASTFNGFPVPKVHAVISEDLWNSLKNLLPLTEDHFTLQNNNWESIWDMPSPPLSSSPPSPSSYMYELIA
ncbi:ornithine decarboxylase-like [Homalodisca vitripennis]|uniref:ornithine decarboxylase-like n=1 Tax=Homalodisca vitripennis TaxID=197043 RepID=UPI001EEA9098|nr:ornithine decarboxylase-like [Homalodisca vitripennis]XP_046682089.1 ornithine decarboxylase-like [Homalodisca vitripennis]